MSRGSSKAVNVSIGMELTARTNHPQAIVDGHQQSSSFFQGLIASECTGLDVVAFRDHLCSVSASSGTRQPRLRGCVKVRFNVRVHGAAADSSQIPRSSRMKVPIAPLTRVQEVVSDGRDGRGLRWGALECSTSGDDRRV